jgi:hypothetical protein
MKKIILSKKKVIMSLICLLFLSVSLSLKANAIDEDSNRGKCDVLPVKIFGFTILKKYNRDCPLSKLPDGRWDWFPN